MTIIAQPDRPGAFAFARTAYRLDPDLPVHNPALTFADAAVKGNLAVGRQGQVMIVDRVDLTAAADVASGPQLLTLRCSNQGDTAGDELLFEIGTVASEAKDVQWSIPRFGYVSQPSFSEPSVIAGGSNWKEANNYLGTYVTDTGGAINDSAEMFLPQLRYLERESAFRQGVRPGAWGSRFCYLLAVTGGLEQYITFGQVVAAPGAGKFSVIRSLIGKGTGNATNYRFGIGYNVVGTVTLAAGSTTTVLNVTSPTLTASAHIGHMAVLVTGNYRGEVRRISANTTTTITVDTAFSGASAATNTLVIVAPIHEWYSGIAVNGQTCTIELTDINIPIPENTAVYWYAEATGSGGAGAPASSFDTHTFFTVGVETMSVAGHNFVNLTGAAQ